MLSLQEMAGYRLLASEVWRRGWEILQIGEGWKREAGTDEADGIVYSRHVARQGKVFRLEVRGTRGEGHAR